MLPVGEMPYLLAVLRSYEVSCSWLASRCSGAISVRDDWLWIFLVRWMRGQSDTVQQMGRGSGAKWTYVVEVMSW